MPPSFGLPPRIQKMSRSKAASAVAALSALVALLSLMKSTCPSRPISSRRCGRPGNVRRARRPPPPARRPRMNAQRSPRARSGCCAGRAASRCPTRSANAPSGPVHGARATSSVPTAYHPCGTRSRAETMSTQLRSASRRRSTMSRHQSSSSPMMARPARLDQSRLQRRVVLHGAVAVEVIGRILSRTPMLGIERGRQLDLERRHLDHMDSVDAGGSRSRMAVPILPPICTSRPAERRMCGDERRRRRLAVGAGDGDERRVGQARLRRSRQNSSISPMTSTPAALALTTVQCGSGWVNGTPGANTRAAKRPHSATSADPPRENRILRPPPDFALYRPRQLRNSPPPASARHVASPERPRPKTATVLTRESRDGVMSAVYPELPSGALQRQAGQQAAEFDP